MPTKARAWRYRGRFANGVTLVLLGCLLAVTLIGSDQSLVPRMVDVMILLSLNLFFVSWTWRIFSAIPILYFCYCLQFLSRTPSTAERLEMDEMSIAQVRQMLDTEKKQLVAGQGHVTADDVEMLQRTIAVLQEHLDKERLAAKAGRR